MIRRAVFWTLPVLVVAVCLWLEQPPAPIPSDAPAAEFSAIRAMEHVAAIARAPHPMGSPENARVREYVVDALSRLGFEPNVQPPSGEPRNVIAHRAGLDNTKAVVLLAHYDSVETGPGAADDAAGVAAILESLANINAGGPLRNDLIVLITDGEEDGLLGARTYVESNVESLEEIGLVLNFEARGNTGSSFMFETSQNNGYLIAEFARSAPRPATTSFSQAIYQKMPNDTDLSVFLEAGLPGLNFAFVGGLPYYHSHRDTPENLDLRSLQHHGSYATALARHFANLNLGSAEAPPATYFSLLSRWVVHYPQSWAPYLAAAALLFFTGIAARLWLKKVIQLRYAAADALALCAATATVAFLIDVIWRSYVYPVSEWDFFLTRHIVWLFLPVGLPAYLVVAVLTRWLSKRHGAKNTVTGVLAVAAVLGSITLWYLPGAVYLFTWPLVGGTYSLALLTWKSGAGQDAPVRTRFAALGLVPAILLFTPVLENLWQLVPFRAIQPVVVSALIGAFVLPVVELMYSRERSRLDGDPNRGSSG